MQMTTDSAGAGFPPVVLFVEDDRDTLDMYSTYLEMSGVWVTPSGVSSEAVGGAADLRPDVVVIDVPSRHRAGSDLLTALKTGDDTHDIPVIVLSGDADLVQGADVCLMKPVLPDVLLGVVETLVGRYRTLRRPSDTSVADGAVVTNPVVAETRGCPECGTPLTWVETRRLGGAEYDYYRPCADGCGLNCFDRTAAKWIKLA